MKKSRWLFRMVAFFIAIGMSAQVRPQGVVSNGQQVTRIRINEDVANAQTRYEAGNASYMLQKYDEAFKFFEKAANAGHPGAQYNLGMCYYEGKGTKQDYKKAVKWLEMAGESDVKDAQYNLAAMYRNGIGVEKDLKKADYWEQKYNVGRGSLTGSRPLAERVYNEVDESPRFPGGDQALMNWLMTNLRYPEEALNRGIQGRVMLSFVVASDGSVVQPQVVKSIHPLLDAEAIRVLLSMPKWTPGKKGGKPVYARCSFPVTFKYVDETPQQNSAESGEQKEQAENVEQKEQPEDDSYAEVIEKVDQNPSFPGGEKALMDWLRKNMKYPPLAQENGIQGRVIAQFVVNKDGSIVEPAILKSVHPLLDAEAMRVALSMPKWTPGRQKGQPVRVRFSLPLTFRLQ